MTATDTGAALTEAMLVAIKMGGPPLVATLIVGIIVALFQAVTQINEATLAFLPKLLALGVTTMVLGSFMLATLVTFTQQLFDRMIAVGGS